MTIQYCDRCGIELKEGEQSGHLTGIDDADINGNGTVTHEADTCRKCYKAIWAFVSAPPKGKA